MNPNELDQFVEKYVEIVHKDGGGASGWVIRVDPETEITETDENGPEKVTGRMVYFDYGMCFFVTHDCHVEEIDPPENEWNGGRGSGENWAPTDSDKG